ncbi:hypothetical protein ACFVH9_08325 [Streptomyces hirsutus]|uniref:hypothetical protein n=1 Tax=Streptomyces hirsutus TaxID=35620 RepID=UPI00363CFB3D
MTSATPEVSKLELAGALILVAQILQARVDEPTARDDGRALLDRRVLLQVAANLPPTARFDRQAWAKAWRASRLDGTRPQRAALYEQMCRTLADELEDEDGRWEGHRDPAEIRRVVSRIRSIETRVCIDDTLGPFDARVDPHGLWNGFVSPSFTLDTVRELAAQTQRQAEECGATSVETVHVTEVDDTDRDGNPLVVVMRVSWAYLREAGAKAATLLVEPDEEGRYSIGGWEWAWDYASWWCVCGRYSDWHKTACWCGLTRDHQPSAPLEVATWEAAATLRRLAPEATSALIDVHGGLAHVISVFAGDAEIDTADDGGVFDTETLGAADAYLQKAMEGATPADLASTPGWQHTPDGESAHAYRITFPSRPAH